MNRDRLTEKLKNYEGLSLVPYPDHLGYCTIGYGRMIDARKGGGISPIEADHMGGVSFPLTMREAEYLLDNDIDQAQNESMRAWPWFLDLDDTRQEVFLCMVFQMGLEGVSGFTNTIAAAARHDWPGVGREMLDSKWARTDTPIRAEEMAKVMIAGDWAAV